MTASLFVIREKNTNTFCTSSKFRHFDADLQGAAIFNQRKNAEKAMRNMFREADKGIVNRYGGWTWAVYDDAGPVQIYHHALLKEYIETLKQSRNTLTDHIRHLAQEHGTEQRCEMKVVEVRLTLV